VDSKQEDAWEKRDRSWRRWEEFLKKVGVRGAPSLDSISVGGRRILAKCFIVLHRTGRFNKEGRYVGERPKPMVAATIRDAIGNVASSFRANDRPSPFHYEARTSSGQGLRKEVKELLAAFENIDPPPNRQKAVTPGLLEDMMTLSRDLGTLYEHTADLAVGAFFFAMRACEFCKTEKRGRTRLLELGDITFRDSEKRVIDKSARNLEERAHYVTVRFRSQKNKVKAESDEPIAPNLWTPGEVQRVWDEPK